MIHFFQKILGLSVPVSGDAGTQLDGRARLADFKPLSPLLVHPAALTGLRTEGSSLSEADLLGLFAWGRVVFFGQQMDGRSRWLFRDGVTGRHLVATLSASDRVIIDVRRPHVARPPEPLPTVLADRLGAAAEAKLVTDDSVPVGASGKATLIFSLPLSFQDMKVWPPLPPRWRAKKVAANPEDSVQDLLRAAFTDAATHGGLRQVVVSLKNKISPLASVILG